MFAYISETKQVQELIFDIPGVCIEARFPRSFLEHVVPVPGDIEIGEGYLFDASTGKFTAPPVSTPDPITPDDTVPIETDEPETYQDMVLRTNRENIELKAGLKKTVEVIRTLEECIVELAAFCTFDGESKRLAPLFATRIIDGKQTMAEVPPQLESQVASVLASQSRQDLLSANKHGFENKLNDKEGGVAE